MFIWYLLLFFTVMRRHYKFHIIRHLTNVTRTRKFTSRGGTRYRHRNQQLVMRCGFLLNRLLIKTSLYGKLGRRSTQLSRYYWLILFTTAETLTHPACSCSCSCSSMNFSFPKCKQLCASNQINPIIYHVEAFTEDEWINESCQGHGGST